MSGSVLSLFYGLSHLISQIACESCSTIIVSLHGEEEGPLVVIYLAQDAQVVTDRVSSASH